MAIRNTLSPIYNINTLNTVSETLTEVHVLHGSANFNMHLARFNISGTEGAIT